MTVDKIQAAQIEFAKKVKSVCSDPRELSVLAEFDAEEKSVFVYGMDAQDNVIAAQSFPLNAAAWNSSLKSEIEKLFRGSAIIYKRGR